MNNVSQLVNFDRTIRYLRLVRLQREIHQDVQMIYVQNL